MQALYRLVFWSGGQPLGKMQMFVRILILLAALTAVASFGTRLAFLAESENDYLRVAVVGPMSGPNAQIGTAMRQGAELYADVINSQGGIDGMKIAIDVYDDKNDEKAVADVVTKAVANKRVQAVVGHWSPDVLKAASGIYDKTGVVAVTPSSTDADILAGSKWTFSALYSTTNEARFLANYSRNVLGHRLASIIYDEAGTGAAMAENFEQTYLRFGTAIRYKWTYDHTSPKADEQIEAIVKELVDKKDAGVLFLAMRDVEAAKLIKRMRDERVRNLLIAPNTLATDSFKNLLAAAPGTGADIAAYTNGMIVSAPLLFDTANEAASNFRSGYIAKFKPQPDWVAAYAYDSVGAVVAGLREGMKGGTEDPLALRGKVREYLESRKSANSIVQGISGGTYFDEKGLAQKPVLVGLYNGQNIISALTQLQPIKPSAGGNFIEELRKGRVLYVNDRFMYKTNVVYTGVQVNDISGFEIKENRYTMDFLIWFRYRGKFEPQDITFKNAVDPIKLEKPLDERVVDDLTYRLYQVKGKFSLDFTDTNREYGTHIAGVSFTHNTLNQNNLLYVLDVLGMGFDTGATALDKIKEARALNPNLGWLMERAWISQDVVAKGTRGDPEYVGYGAAEPEFSKVDLGVLLTPAEFKARDVIPQEFFIYIGIFGLLGAIFAVAMDRKEKGRFWAVQSWIMRVVAWPALLLAAGNIALSLAFRNLPEHMIGPILMCYSMMWWIVPARLLGIATERFVWQPLEDHTERAIPNVIRSFASVVIYSFAGFGIIAFVFDEQLTSLLASTGLLAMIVGLAIQSNIANIFSGIVINLERPFNVGDWIQIGDVEEGKVVDITWRTTRIMTRDGYLIAVPNGQVSESQIHNFDSFDCVRLELKMQLDGALPPRETAAIMQNALNKFEGILDSPEREVRFRGVKWETECWIGEYELEFWINNYGERESVSEKVLEYMYAALRANGITFGAPMTDEDVPDGLVMRAREVRV
jgi:ABC-type branched-subunit amino acid transport system substrate-binding protein/small-conductance mechanosensitive channel